LTEQSSSYRAAGVDIDAKYKAVQDARAAIRSTYTDGVVGDVGLFGGLFDPARVGAAGELLVASTDGVGTKVKVAQAAGRLRGIGHDLVNHCVGDILVQGARPLFFLDYIAVDRMVPEAVTEVIVGLAEACRRNGCALLGGETAEMPGVYRPGEMDIAGTIVGSVARDRLLDGSRIAAGDLLLALPSSGLHTNGYSLARRALLENAGMNLDDRPAVLGGASIADALLEPHRTYLPTVWPMLDAGLVHGMAHITGGGLPDNVPRVLPADLGVAIEKAAMPRPPIFDLIVAAGGVSEREAYRVFNMGFGMVLFVAPEAAERVLAIAAEQGDEARVVGRVVAGQRNVDLV
jgi:phosphoribosylformylglycinamidine cyclo-ligase